ncbi:MAG: LLM class flavin-dependent oxidoreductase [Chloroflexi bacterium]|nr:LLM class flavin-dependent oxidoreductase [Chloroflexota bacterium]
MRFASVYYPHYPHNQSPVEMAQSVIAHAYAAQEAGFDMVWTGHHYLTEYQTLQPIPMLARLTGQVPDMLLGASFILPLVNPVDFAEQTASLDVLSGGKFICNAVMGYRDVEFATFGIPKARRVSRLEESVELVKRLWTEDRVTFEGKNFRLRDVSLSTKPLQKPRPPMWVGGNSEAAVRRIAVIGDAWAMGPYATLAALKAQVAVYDRALVAAGKDPKKIQRVLLRDAYIAKDNATALEQARPFLQRFYAQYARWGKEDAMGRPGELTQDFDLLLRDRFIVGGPETFIKEITRYRTELQLDWLLIQINRPEMPLNWILQGVRLLGKSVLPVFQK